MDIGLSAGLRLTSAGSISVFLLLKLTLPSAELRLVVLLWGCSGALDIQPASCLDFVHRTFFPMRGQDT